MCGMNLQTIESGFLHPFRCAAKVLHNLVYLFSGNFSWKVHTEGILHGRRSNGLYISIYSMLGLTARMIHLTEKLGLIFVNRFRQFFISLNLLIIVKAGNELVALCVLIDSIILCDDHTPSALRFFFNIANITLGNHTICSAQVHHHGRHNQSVGNLTVSDFSRSK